MEDEIIINILLLESQLKKLDQDISAYAIKTELSVYYKLLMRYFNKRKPVKTVFSIL